MFPAALPLLTVLLIAIARLWPQPETCAEPQGRTWSLRAGERTYLPALACATNSGGYRVLTTPRSDSALRDLAALAAMRGYAALLGAGPLVLVTELPGKPVTALDDWPTPPGNLYAAAHLDLPPLAAARLACESAAALARTVVAGSPAGTQVFVVRVELGSDGTAYGSVRAGEREDAPLVAGVSALPIADGALVGVDVHLAAGPAAYGKHATAHVSLHTLAGHAPATLAGLRTWLRPLHRHLHRP